MELKVLAPAIVTVAAQLFAGPVANAAQPQASTPVALDSVVKQKMDEAGIVGLGAAIIVDGKVVWTKGYGFADKKRGVPFTPDTIMNIGSISKTFGRSWTSFSGALLPSRVGHSSAIDSARVRRSCWRPWRPARAFRYILRASSAREAGSTAST